MPTEVSFPLAEPISRADAWFDSMRSTDGYGGPVAHWWQNCLQFTGAGLDWRYEGIICAYVNLYSKTGMRLWLDKAKRAGDDLVRGQLPTGNYRNSSFELNPYSRGTPHEAAADIGLLSLAETLKAVGDPLWEGYFSTAKRNIEAFYLQLMWDPETRSFRDSPKVASFVPNKSSTLCEALFKLSTLTGDAVYVERYALPTLDSVVDYQVNEGDLAGAIYQNSFGREKVVKFLPYYVARCVPALLLAYEWKHDERYLNAALKAMDWTMRQRQDNGGFTQVVYPNGRTNRYQEWIAGAGDILRAAVLAESYGFKAVLEPTLNWMLQHQTTAGGFYTAWGFGAQISQQPPSVPEFRDVLPVCGWADKAFRLLTELLPDNADIPANTQLQTVEQSCSLRGKEVRYREDSQSIQLDEGDKPLYRWIKGDPWAAICDAKLLWK